MRDLSQLSELELKEAHDAAEALLSERFRACFSSPMLSTLLTKFRDDCLDALGRELPPRLPLRVRRQKLEVLTDAELAALTSRVETLLGGFADYIDDPALLAGLADVRSDVATGRGDRTIVRATFGQRAEVS